MTHSLACGIAKRNFSPRWQAQHLMPATAFVTGATGFVGINLIEALVAKSWTAHALTRDVKSGKAAKLLQTIGNGKVNLVQGDVNSGNDALAALMPDNVDVIFHIVHVQESTKADGRLFSAPGYTPEGRSEHLRLNLEAMAAVVHAARVKNVRRVVYCSSWSAYGIQGGIFDESAPTLAYAPSPLGFCTTAESTPYFVCKHECEPMPHAVPAPCL